MLALALLRIEIFFLLALRQNLSEFIIAKYPYYKSKPKLLKGGISQNINIKTEKVSKDNCDFFKLKPIESASNDLAILPLYCKYKNIAALIMKYKKTMIARKNCIKCGRQKIQSGTGTAIITKN